MNALVFWKLCKKVSGRRTFACIFYSIFRLFFGILQLAETIINLNLKIHNMLVSTQVQKPQKSSNIFIHGTQLLEFLSKLCWFFFFFITISAFFFCRSFANDFYAKSLVNVRLEIQMKVKTCRKRTKLCNEFEHDIVKRSLMCGEQVDGKIKLEKFMYQVD